MGNKILFSLLNAKYTPSLVISYDIPFIFQAAALLAVFTYPSHIVIYASGDAFTYRCSAT
ncbi:hypothetical protein EAE89_13005 [Photorhabdus heterorhabditis]|nr:hypothetical protein [Photorhabdus heterorhabditis]